MAIYRMCLAVTAAICAAAIAGAASPKPVSFVCTFAAQKLTLTFVVDIAKAKPSDAGEMVGTAVLVGNAGTETVDMIVGANAVSFIERVVTGAVQTTTVQLKTLAAVHSRHTLMGVDGKAEFVPSQASGSCERKD